MNKIDSQFPRFGSPGYRFQKGAALVAVIVAIIVLAVVGTGVSLATRVWDPLWSPFRPEPKEVVDKTISKMAELDTLEMDIELSIEKGEEKVLLGLDVAADNKEEKFKGSYNFSATGKEEASGDIETLSIGKELYIKMNSINLPDSFPLGDMSSFEGEWIKFPSAEEGSSQWSVQDNIGDIKDIYSIRKELKDEKIDGFNSYHYILVLEKEGLRDLIKDSIKEEGSNPLVGSMEEQIDETVEALGNLEIGVWIDKKENLLKKIEIEETFTLEGEEAVLKVVSQFSQFNQLVTVEAPEESVNFEEVIFQLLMGGNLIQMPSQNVIPNY